MHPADAFEAQQEPVEFVLPGEHALDRPEALFEDGGLDGSACGPASTAFCRTGSD